MKYKRDINLIEYWLIDATLDEIREYVETEPYNKASDLFLNWLLNRFEQEEEYERCIIVKNEIDFRTKLYNQLNSDSNME